MKRITMAHGAGGTVMGGLIKEVILRHLEPDFGEHPLRMLDDASAVDGTAVTTDSYVVQPIIFPGGDIGRLAVSGTVNDLCCIGAEPLALTMAMVLEEGLDIAVLERILASAGSTAEEAGVHIVAGDTKVVERGGVRDMVVTTSGFGRRWQALEENLDVLRGFREYPWNWISDSGAAPGDAVIVSGTIGDHGVAIISQREGYGFTTDIRSDVRPLNHLAAEALRAGGVACMKDPTRGGVAGALNEISEKSGVGIVIEEEELPIRDEVMAASEMLGIDPLVFSNEGKLLLCAAKERAEVVLQALRRTEEGRDARIIGRCDADISGVVLRTTLGGRRIIEPPEGDPVPRIC